MTDTMIMDALQIPDERREEFLISLHAWARSLVPGPGRYAVFAALLWHSMKNGPLWPMPDDPFDIKAWA
ncbi:hypothetical protein [Mycobacterium sp. AZCC_0083]|uniref:hypothetical protein n=1 Tax=Mycobacterium sp. AZCC_0083 TaxID=2735882 RepID=UPI00161B43F7|nr:hypothetical protein [Mycobacterium sp. AZCC_0083]MBB5167151.1 hypothetical protein [Mycobacterium sp. AZCC_0083]